MPVPIKTVRQVKKLAKKYSSGEVSSMFAPTLLSVVKLRLVSIASSNGSKLPLPVFQTKLEAIL